MFVHSFDTKSAPQISRKPFDLASPNSMGTSIPALSTATPDMPSLSTSGRQQIARTCKLWVIFGSRFLDNGSTDSEKVYSFGNCRSRASVPFLQPIIHFCSLAPKMGLKWASHLSPKRVTQMADFDFLGNY